LIFNGELVYNQIHRFNKYLLHLNGEQKLVIYYGKIYQCDEKQSRNIFKRNNNINLNFSVIMRPAEVQLTIEHQLPVLLYESYPIKIQIKNCENVDINSAT
jgi:hypothetical protein